jgi:hypothetical protein
MATVVFRGDAKADKQSGTIQVTAYDATTTYAIIINGKSITTLGVTDAAGTASALYDLLTASEYPEFQEIDYEVSTDTLTLTAKTAGKSFTVTTSETGGTGSIGNYVAVTANSGPNNLSVVANYSTGALPGGGDTLIFENVDAVNITEGLTALAGIALAQVWFRNWGGEIGLPQHNGRYWEYRNTYLQLQATEVIFDCPNCQLARIDSQTYQTTLKVYSTGTSRVQNLETLCWKGTHNSNVVQADRGSIGIAVLAGETATVATLNCGYVSQPESDSNVRCRSVTLTTVNRIGGTLELNGGATTVNSRTGSGKLTVFGSGAFTTINCLAGDMEYLGSGTITTLLLGSGQRFDSSRNEVGFTITNVVVMYKDAYFYDPAKRATMSGGYIPTGCTQEEIKVNRGINVTCTAV